MSQVLNRQRYAYHNTYHQLRLFMITESVYTHRSHGMLPNHTREEKLRFWEYLESLLELSDYSNESSVNSSLVSYIQKASQSYNDYITHDQDLYRTALIILNSKLFENDKEFCISKILSLLSIDNLEMSMKFILSYIILCECKIDSNSLDFVLDYQGFTVIYNNLYSQFAYLSRYGDERVESCRTDQEGNLSELDLEIIQEFKRISTVLLDLLFQIFKYSKCEITNLQKIDDFFVYYLMSTIRSDTFEDLFNNAKFRLLLALNEQYVIALQQFELENKVFEYLLDNQVSKNFVEFLMLQFNRETDKSLQIMMSKIFYLVLSAGQRISMNFFYLNDLNVVVDVLIRNLTNLSEEEELLRNTFLRVLHPLLKNTEWTKTRYRYTDLSKLLEYLSCLDNICSTKDVNFEQISTTKLAFKCLEEMRLEESEKHTTSTFTKGSMKSEDALNSTLASCAVKNGRHFGKFLEPVRTMKSVVRSPFSSPPPPPPSRKA
ncbi:Ldb17p Ecym_8074 [Eremothecium cymbalariae DBVPG|uniref:SPIN90/Ldb17 leucine-rich domain-containing protein n=1 Tax=Eremothecium cymbalariae (strain CBS 270.75 / DBVPG 7215 / KCTC 17166 / NRRL Y-17582) TaxID=931890 RepID=G8JWZ6_ERECY|nr:Hypothetical protein Ecym_8074 [Eremothecium cymbalariae DBVPG\